MAFHSGDLVGVQDTRGAQLAIVEAVQGSKLRLHLGFDAKSVVLPQRQIQLLSPLPAGGDPPARLGASPWHLSAESLQAARPGRRAWAAAWLLLQEADEAVSLAEFSELVSSAGDPSSAAVQRAACWLELVGPQLWFRWRQEEISARSLQELRPLRRERRQGRAGCAAAGL